MTVIPHGLLSGLGPFLALLTVVPVGLLLAPRDISRDKRVLVFAVLLVGAVGFDVFTKICDWCPLCIECWFPS